MNMHDRHMEMIDAVNNATDPSAKIREECKLQGWRKCYTQCGYDLGHLLIRADLEQIDRGYDGPMCCGVYL